MIKQTRKGKEEINKDIKINLDNDFKVDNEIIDSSIINISRNILDDLIKGKSEGNRIKLSGSLISFQLFIHDVIQKSKTKPDKNQSGSYGDPIINQTKN